LTSQITSYTKFHKPHSTSTSTFNSTPTFNFIIADVFQCLIIPDQAYPLVEVVVAAVGAVVVAVVAITASLGSSEGPRHRWPPSPRSRSGQRRSKQERRCLILVGGT
jgi:hypothetical protein